MIHITGQHYLARFDPAMGSDHCRARAVNDVQHLGILEDQCTQAVGRTGFTQAQVERVQVQVAQVFQCAQVQRALQVIGHCRTVQQLHLLAHATAAGLGLEGAQFVHVRRFHCRMQVAALEVAVDAIARHALLDHLMSAPAQVPDEVVDFATQVVAHLRAHGLITRQAAGDLATIAPAGTPADAVGFDDGHLQATLGQAPPPWPRR